MPHDDQRDVPETGPNEAPIPADGPVEQPFPDPPLDDPAPIEVPEGMPEEAVEPIEVPDEDLEPIEVPDEDSEAIKLPEGEESEPIDLPDDDEPDPQLIEVVRDLERQVASQGRDLAEVMANMPVAPPDDFFAQSEPPAGPNEIAGPVQLRPGDGIDSIMTPLGGSFSASRPFAAGMPVGAGEIEWGIAALPSNRAGGDTCAWMRPATDGSYGYCYVVPTDPPTSSVLDTPGAAAISAEGEEGFVKVTFWGAGYGRPQEPNVRGGDLVPFIRVGGIALGIGFLDAPIGKVTLLFEPDVFLTTTAGVPEGWIIMGTDSTFNKPNTNVETLGDEITNTDTRQTLLVSEGNQDFAGVPDDEEFPIPRDVGTVDVAFQRFVHRPNGTSGDLFNVYGSYFIPLQRIN